MQFIHGNCLERYSTPRQLPRTLGGFSSAAPRPNSRGAGQQQAGSLFQRHHVKKFSLLTTFRSENLFQEGSEGSKICSSSISEHYIPYKTILASPSGDKNREATAAAPTSSADWWQRDPRHATGQHHLTARGCCARHLLHHTLCFKLQPKPCLAPQPALCRNKPTALQLLSEAIHAHLFFMRYYHNP